MADDAVSDEVLATQPIVEWFRPSLKSPWRGVRIGVAILLAGLVLLLWMTTSVWNARDLALMALLLGFAVALDYAIRHQIMVDQSPVVLTIEGLESANLGGTQKTYAWRDLANAWIVPVGNGNALHLELVPGVPTTAGSWLSRRSQPFIPLSTYSATEQDLIVDAVMRHLSRTHCRVMESQEQTPEHELIGPLIATAPRPWVTYTLILLSVLLWLLLVSQGLDPWRPTDEALLRWGGSATSEVQRGQWWRVVSAAFVHAGLIPLAVSMLGLWSVGSSAERIYGRRPYLLIFAGSAMIGSAVSLHLSAQYMVFAGGACSAVFGLIGALLLVLYQHHEMRLKLMSRSELAALLLFLVYALIQGFRPSGLDNGAHLGGLLAGALLAALLPERFDMRQYEATITQRSTAGLASAIGLSALLILLAAPAHTDVPRQWTGPAEFDKGVKRFAEASRLMQQLRDQVKAGQMTEQEFDAKTRSVLAPAFGQALAHFSQGWFPASDPRQALLSESTRLTGLMVELLAMRSVVLVDSLALAPADPQRAMLLNAEIRASAERQKEIEASLQALAQATKK